MNIFDILDFPSNKLVREFEIQHTIWHNDCVKILLDGTVGFDP